MSCERRTQRLWAELENCSSAGMKAELNTSTGFSTGSKFWVTWLKKSLRKGFDVRGRRCCHSHGRPTGGSGTVQSSIPLGSSCIFFTVLWFTRRGPAFPIRVLPYALWVPPLALQPGVYMEAPHDRMKQTGVLVPQNPELTASPLHTSLRGTGSLWHSHGIRRFGALLFFWPEY